MSKQRQGKLVIIGGHEDKEGDQDILTMVAEETRKGKRGHLVVITAATEKPEAMAREYTRLFKELGVERVEVVDVRSREEAKDEASIRKMDGAVVIFFTGGDQLRITSQMGDSPVYRCIQEIYEAGGTIVGTSAGAAAMPDTMLVNGPGDESTQLSSIGMAPGLGLLHDVVTDSHFAERGRMGRLLAAVAQNPKNLGIGIDEDTAIVVENRDFYVLGSGAVYVVDGQHISYSSLSEKDPTGLISLYNVRLHVLRAGDRFDLDRRQPINAEQEQQQAERQKDKA